MQDSKAISLAKAVSWRTTGSLATFCIVYYATGRLDLAAAVGGSETVIKIVLFYLHERIWARLTTLKLSRATVYSESAEYDMVPAEPSTSI